MLAGSARSGEQFLGQQDEPERREREPGESLSALADAFTRRLPSRSPSWVTIRVWTAISAITSTAEMCNRPSVNPIASS
jgi:hypothetical protein